MITPQEAAVKYPNYVRVGEDGVTELYADNHMLSSLRTCESYFDLGILQNNGSPHRSWPLTFGQWFHRAMEYFYAHQQAGTPIELAKWCQLADRDWKAFDMESFKETRQFKALGGRLGALALLSEYWEVYGRGQERLRVVGMELPFGHLKEVPLLTDHELYPWAPFRAYYCGRIDLIIDNGYAIGPVDHKTTAYFDGHESAEFKPHDGMQGYVFGLNTILGEKFRAEGKPCNTMVVNHVSLRQGKTAYDRFKRSFLSYTPEELEEWRIRQISSFSVMHQLIVDERPAQWNAGIQCHNMYFHDCPFKSLHGVTPSTRPILISAQYVKREPWDFNKDGKEHQSPEQALAATPESETPNVALQPATNTGEASPN